MKTTTATVKAECSMKCNFGINQCSAFKFDKETKPCIMGQFHPSNVTCCDGQETISIRGDIFDQDIIKVLTVQAEASYFSQDLALSEPFIPKSTPWGTEQNLNNFIKFYANEAFYFCHETPGENCHKWNMNSNEWIDTGTVELSLLFNTAEQQLLHSRMFGLS